MVNTRVGSSYIYIQYHTYTGDTCFPLHFAEGSTSCHVITNAKKSIIYIPQGRLSREEHPFSMRQFGVLGDMNVSSLYYAALVF